MKKSIILAVVTTALLSQSIVTAQVSNGGFTGSLASWDTIGDAAVRDNAAFLTTADIGETPAKNFSGNATVGAFGSSGLEGFVGLADGALDPDASNSVFAFEGSVIKQSLTIQADHFIRFEWRLLTDEAAGSDYAFAFIDDGAAPIFVTLANSSDATSASVYGYSFSTSLATYTSPVYTLDTPVTISFGIVDVGDSINASALTLDNVSSIPEPTSMVILGLACLAFILHRRFRVSQS